MTRQEQITHEQVRSKVQDAAWRAEEAIEELGVAKTAAELGAAFRKLRTATNDETVWRTVDAALGRPAT